MRRGDLAAAWQISDAVLAARDPATRDDPARPYHDRWVWDGRDLTGLHVVVRCYHGLGDTLQFVRFIPALRARAASVTLEVQPELAGLLARAPGIDRLVRFDTAAPIAADHDIEIMELQHALRMEPPADFVLPVTPASGFGTRTGVCWQAGGWDNARTIPLPLLRPLLPPGSISLQRGARLPDGLSDPLGGSMDIAGVAALIAGLRRVVTVDTMIAHLAGTLGRPVHILLKCEADWRWGEGTRTGWYPSARLHRQSVPGDWAAAVSSLATALED